MVKKTKSKKRLDKFYYLAREVGFRSRASFKLIQLDKRYNCFLSRSRVAIDLCSAPGSWLQVLSKFMPSNSIRIGVDLDPIKPIPGCTTFQGDITTQKCVNTIKKELKHFQADVVLNDGAPNVGAQWGKDAFTQTELVLYAAKIANTFLRKGGTFVSKVFRSRDYTTLISVLRQMFERVDTTKPQASRQSSAEIFVVCLNFKAQKQDPKLFDPKVVFASGSAYAGEAEAIDQERMKISSLKQFLTKRANRAGYEDNTKQFIYQSGSLSDFIKAEDPFQFLRKVNKITLSGEEDSQILQRVKPNKMTVKEFQECCQDTKVLGKTELTLILKYRERVRRILAKDAKKAAKEARANEEDEVEEESIDSDEEDQNELERIIAVKEQERKKAAKKKEERRKKGLIGNKMAVLGASLSKNQLPVQDDQQFEGFDEDLRQYLKEHDIEDIERKADQSEEEEKGSNDQGSQSELDPYEDDFLEKKIEKMEQEITDQYKRKREEQSLLTRKEVKKRAREEEEIKQILEEGVILRKEDKEELEEKEEASEESEVEEGESEVEEEDDEESQEEEGEDDEEQEEEEEGQDDESEEDEEQDDEEEEDEKVNDSESEMNVEEGQPKAQKSQSIKKRGKSSLEKEEDLLQISKQWFKQDFFNEKDFQQELVQKGLDLMPKEKSQRELRKEKLKKQREKEEKKEAKLREAGTGGTLGELLDTKTKIEEVPRQKFDEYDSDDIAETLAIAKKMVRKKDRREILEASYNRYCFAADDNAPEWFREDELLHYRPNLPITKEEVQAQKQALRDYNARPIKKVAEARIRKKKRLQKAMQKAKAKAMQIANQSEITEASKARQIETIYKKTKARAQQKKQKQYVIASKGGAKKAAKMGHKVSSKGGKGKKMVMVDPRMKKDKRGEKRALLLKKKRFH